MSWRVPLPDGTLSEPFDTFEEADAFARTLEETDPRTPEEIYDAEPRPRVRRDVFMRRIAMGWTAHRAVSTTLDGRYMRRTPDRTRDRVNEGRARVEEQMGGATAKVHEVEGRRRTLRQWSESCGIDPDTLRKRAARHGSLAAYFEEIGWSPDKPAKVIDLTDPALYD